MALTAPTPPTPPAPPTIDKGDAAESHAKIDAHKFFNLPFERKEKPAVQAETPAPSPPAANPTPEKLARDAVANGAGALTKKVVTHPADEEIPRPVQTAPSRDGKAILREFQNEDVQPMVETPRNFNYSPRESHGGIFWAVALILVGVASFVFAKKFLLKKNPAPKIDTPKVPASKKPVKSKHFEVRI